MAIIKKFRIKSFKDKNSIIEFENISLSYGNRLILDNISFRINEGQIFGMLGPNGVGKSTIFNLITGLISPKHGKIKINGQLNIIDDKIKLSNLLKSLKVPLRKVAIELNKEIIDKKKLNNIYLKKNDKIEIVHFIGGG